MTDLPNWVYDVVTALMTWTEEHPKLYVYAGADQYVPAEGCGCGCGCGCGALAMVPVEVCGEARVIAAYRAAEGARSFLPAGGEVSPVPAGNTPSPAPTEERP